MAAVNSPRASTEGSTSEIEQVVPTSTSGPFAIVVHNAAAAKNAEKKAAAFVKRKERLVLMMLEVNSVSVLQRQLEAARKKRDEAKKEAAIESNKV